MDAGAAAAEKRFSAQRRAMVDGQIRTFSVTDPTVIEAFSIVPRERFLPEALRDLAYSDAILTLPAGTSGGHGRVLLQPMVLARLLQGASIAPGSRTLVVGGGTGYAACLLARIATDVITLETDAAWTAAADGHARDLGLSNVRAVTGALARGFAEGAPYDVILIQGAVETGFDGLFDQLAPTGRLVTGESRARDAARRTGKAVAFERIGGDVSGRPLFEAMLPVIGEFRRPAEFVF